MLRVLQRSKTSVATAAAAAAETAARRRARELNSASLLSAVTASSDVSVQRLTRVHELLERAAAPDRPVLSLAARLATFDFCMAALAADGNWAEALHLLDRTADLYRGSQYAAADAVLVTWLIRLARAPIDDASPLSHGAVRSWSVSGIARMAAADAVIDRYLLAARSPRTAADLAVVATAAIRELHAAQMPESVFLLVLRAVEWFSSFSQLSNATLELRNRIVDLGQSVVADDAPLHALYVDMQSREALKRKLLKMSERGKALQAIKS